MAKEEGLIKGWIKDAGVLLEAYNPCPRPSWKEPPSCELCAGPVSYWCVECEKSFCPACTARLHHPGLSTVDHSIEVVEDESFQGVKIISPFVTNGLAIFGVWYLLTHVQLKEDYLYTAHLCPTVNIIAKWMAWFDTKVFYMSKGSLNTSCGVEDYLYKLFLDTWVRDIVTQSDDVTLLVFTTIMALSCKAVLNYFLVPVIAVVMAFVQTVIHRAELCLPRSDVLVKVEGWVETFDLLGKLGGPTDVPPVTQWRLRPDRDLADLWAYWKARSMKRLLYYYQTTAENVDYYTTYAVWGVALFRLICIVTPAVLGFEPGAVLRSIFFHVGFADVITKQEAWFKHSSPDMLSDEVVLSAGMSALGSRHYIPSSWKDFLMKMSLLAGLVYAAWYYGKDLVNEKLGAQFKNFEENMQAYQYKMGCDDAATCDCKCCKFWHDTAEKAKKEKEEKR